LLIAKIAFIGPVRTGQIMGELAARKVMPVTLNLVGRSPNIVFEDAKLEAAILMVLFDFIANSGQICSSGTRVLVQRSIYDKFSHMLTVAAQQISIGIDNHFPTLGPIAHQMQYDKVMAYFDTARDGATIITGGEKAPVKVWTKAYTSSRLFSQM
jgi:aldehyde dehydrogenase (NAD+)